MSGRVNGLARADEVTEATLGSERAFLDFGSGRTDAHDRGRRVAARPVMLAGVIATAVRTVGPAGREDPRDRP
jgi:hypothetical protein